MKLSIKGVPLVVRVADDEVSRANGLMHTDGLEENSGMLFRWPTPEPRSFWMKDTSLPLDIAYISDKGEILSIQEMEPFSLRSVVSPGPASCALEVNRGWFNKNGIEAGDIVDGVFNDMPRLSESLDLYERAEFRLSDPDFYYGDVIDDVIDDIMKQLPTEMGDEEIDIDDVLDYTWPYPIDADIWSENYEDSVPSFDIDLQIIPTPFEDSHPGWNINGSAGWGAEGGNIELQIELRPGFELTPEKLISLERELSNVIAHEIHHLTQERGPFERPSCASLPPRDGDSYYSYFTSACEIPAFLIGFRAESSRSGRSVEDLIRGYLQNQTLASLISPEEAEDIASKWLSHTRWNKG
jgi:uncharacterized membrane protein (UPF0127 family)